MTEAETLEKAIDVFFFFFHGWLGGGGSSIKAFSNNNELNNISRKEKTEILKKKNAYKLENQKKVIQ